MMIVLKTNDELSNECVSKISRRPKALRLPIQNNEKRPMTVFKSAPSMPYISGPIELSTSENTQNPKLIVLNIEN